VRYVDTGGRGRASLRVTPIEPNLRHVRAIGSPEELLEGGGVRVRVRVPVRPDKMSKSLEEGHPSGEVGPLGDVQLPGEQRETYNTGTVGVVT
jgi:hypothetical protein